jgi:hypothetical protein
LIYCRPKTSNPAPGHKIFPYLLRGKTIDRANQVWASDITYIPMARGFLYLAAVMDWFARPWRTVKYEEAYLKAYESVAEARSSIGHYLEFYNGRRPPRLTSARPIKPTTPCCPAAWQHNARQRRSA